MAGEVPGGLQLGAAIADEANRKGIQLETDWALEKITPHRIPADELLDEMTAALGG